MSNTITAGDLGRALWRGAPVIAATTFLLFIGAVAYLHLARPVYTAAMTVTAVESDNRQIGGQLSGLASLAGVSLGSKQSSPIELYQEGLRSRMAAEALSSDEELMRSLFAREWDQQQSRWRRPDRALDGTLAGLRKILGLQPKRWTPPNAQRLQRLLRSTVTVSSDPESPLTEVSVDHHDPNVAERLLQQLHARVDASLRRRAIERTGRYIGYLRTQLATVTVADYRQALTAALADQEKQRMVAMSGLAYAAEVFDAPSASSQPTKPKGILLISVALLCGLLLGVLIVLYRAFFSASSDDHMNDLATRQAN